MAISGSVWAIDIGECALKALRCTAGDMPDQVEAEAFDYIEYPKIASQPDADRDELIAEALTQFISRNSLVGCKVAISVSGQSGLARFIKLPPVESKKIPDIVRYEARQQIPFDLNDVVWDYQQMGGAEEEGFSLETEIGLFAMKRETVFRALQPFRDAGIEVDIVQLTPLCLYNSTVFDRMTDLPSLDEYDPEDPPPSTVIMSLGTDATDLVVTNGFRVWQRSIPIGGNHFTKALTKSMKLTFAKAEHLKRNVASTQDSKAVYQAMRPVFKDLVTEMQRSIGFFSNLDKTATIDGIVALGNGMKLPGLRKFLEQSLGFKVERGDRFRGLVGPQVIAAPAFKENVLSFSTCYGLALQALQMGGLRTNLLPREIIQERMIRKKKPWAVGAAAVLLLSLSVHFGMASAALKSVEDEKWKQAETEAKQVCASATELVNEKAEAEKEFEEINAVGENLVGNTEGRIMWLELLKMVNGCLPRDDEGERPEDLKDITKRNELQIVNMECQKTNDLSRWFNAVRDRFPDDDPSLQTSSEVPEGETPQVGPSGPGWIIQLSGHHYYSLNSPKSRIGNQFIRETLVANLRENDVILPKADGKDKEVVSTNEMGIGYPVLMTDSKGSEVEVVDENTGEKVTVLQQPFVVQFCWQQTPPSKRLENKLKQAALESQQAEAEGEGE